MMLQGSGARKVCLKSPQAIDQDLQRAAGALSLPVRSEVSILGLLVGGACADCMSSLIQSRFGHGLNSGNILHIFK